MFERAKDFLEEIEPLERVLLIYHTDSDGVCSAALMLAGLERMGTDVRNTIYAKDLVDVSQKIAKIMECADRIIIVDVPVETMKNLPKGKKILIFDHHPSRDVNSTGVVLVNPMLQNARLYQPVSYIVYKFFSQIFDMSRFEWIAAVGTVADFGYDDCVDLLKKYIPRKPRNLKTTTLSKVADKLNSYMNYANVDGALRLLRSVGSIEELRNNGEVNEAHERFQTELKAAEREFMKNAEKYEKENLIIGVVDCEENRRLGSALSSVISVKHPGKTVIIVANKGDVYSVHARNQEGRIDVGRLMKASCDIEGGGHVKAAGGKVKDIGAFKEKVLSKIKVFRVK